MIRSKSLALAFASAALVLCSTFTSSAQTSFNPPSFSSSHGVLDLLLIARPQTIHLGAFSPTAYIYEVCQTSLAANDQCPADSRTVSTYSGVVLQLQPGDHLRMRLVNHLPPAPADAENAHGPDAMMNEMLAANPTNIHTHGLIVEPRKADASDPTFGDYVYVVGYPAGKLPSMIHPDLTATDQPIQYDIYIPQNHPAGMFFFHPHVHGLGVNQISEGLEGILVVGSVQDVASKTADFTLPPKFSTRYIHLRDMQVLANGDAQDQEDPEFCTPLPDKDDLREGYCAGTNLAESSATAGKDYTGGKWFFTVNGLVYPTLNIDQKNGEVWRLLNGSATRAYDLTIKNDKNHAPILFQVIALDGVALAPPAGTDVSSMDVGNRFKPVPCPGPKQAHRTSEPVCATHMVMFPSSRADVFLGSFQPGHVTSATLITTDMSTGPDGDDWPSAKLAHLDFTSPGTNADATLNVKPTAQFALSAKGALGGAVKAMYPGMTQPIPIADAKQIATGKRASLPVALEAAAAQQVQSLSSKQVQQFAPRLAAQQKPVASIASPNCAALPAGHHRRIFFGVPSSNPDGFGLGYEEVDAHGNSVAGTFQDVAEFDPTNINVCLPLAPGNQTATELWELVNVAAEAHNFHIHQTKFLVLSKGAPAGDGGALMDNVTLPSGSAGCDGSVLKWRDGTCKVNSEFVSIPFSEIGDFVYHCHIGEHQDGGMMAHIRVIANH
ncbi:multicopper oxidase domain-containing protein [Occallatibacter savannae]|uniref:multicopper oxidase domain-containing protein n=1 Tax=Occallatibacter savannae TaxID=1002691 RepID=UPI0013A5B9BE|nr:multicopper oxidase domain-containing protein [Occallatibacter savannae]